VQAQTISRYEDLLIEALAKKAMYVRSWYSWLLAHAPSLYSYPNSTVLHGRTGTTV
jgi:hypothetical protein